MTTDPTPIYVPGDDPAPRLRPSDSTGGTAVAARRARPVDERDAHLAGRLRTLEWRCEEIAATLPADRVPAEQLVELADAMREVARMLDHRARAAGVPQVIDVGDSGGR